MKCIECRYMEPVGKNGLYICKNENSENFGEYTGICCEDECEDGEEQNEIISRKCQETCRKEN